MSSSFLRLLDTCKQRVNVGATARFDVLLMFSNLWLWAQVVDGLELVSTQREGFSHGKLQPEPVIQGTEGRNRL